MTNPSEIFMGNIIIREANKNDLFVLQELWKEMMCFHSEKYGHLTVTKEGEQAFIPYITGYIEDKNNARVIVAENTEKIIGFCLAYRFKRPPFFAMKEYVLIDYIAISKHYRNKSIGTMLLESIKKWTQTIGLTRIELLAATSNECALGFWTKKGFRPYITKMYFDLI